MKAISKINNTLAKIEGAVMVFWFAIVLVVMTCQVVSRYIFNAPIAWSEEFARYSFVWISYIGCAYCVSVDAHTGHHRVPRRAAAQGQEADHRAGQRRRDDRVHPSAAHRDEVHRQKQQVPDLDDAHSVQVSVLFLPVGCVLTVVHLILKSILLFAPDTIEKA